ncbi:MAG: addiction module protein [Planctomycetales bacterium]
MSTPEDLTQQALALPPEERAMLADMLEQSLYADETTKEEFSAFWTAELDRRLASYRQDPSRAVDAKTALAEIQKRLEARRAGKSE